MNPESLLIIGSGALATLFAARLGEGGVEVTLLGTWPEGLSALSTRGARLAGAERAYPLQVTARAEDCFGCRYALVLVKAWQTERAADQLKVCLAEDGLALTLQNGLGNREVLARRLGRKRVALGVTTLGATLLEPGLVRLAGEGPITLEAQPRLAGLEAMLKAAGFSVQVLGDARTVVWGKLVISAAINPLTALLRVPNGELLKRPTARRLLGELAGEAARVAKARGVALPFGSPQRAAEQVARRTADNRSSMLQDVLRGAPTEVEAINGAVVRLGQRSGVPTPVNRLVWRLVKALTDRD